MNLSGGHILSLSLIRHGLLYGILSTSSISNLLSPWIVDMMKLTNVFDLQVFFLGVGSRPVLLDICTDWKNENFSSPSIVPSSICEIILALCSAIQNKSKSKTYPKINKTKSHGFFIFFLWTSLNYRFFFFFSYLWDWDGIGPEFRCKHKFFSIFFSMYQYMVSECCCKKSGRIPLVSTQFKDEHHRC